MSTLLKVIRARGPDEYFIRQSVRQASNGLDVQFGLFLDLFFDRGTRDIVS